LAEKVNKKQDGRATTAADDGEDVDDELLDSLVAW
jgi:hypothetical protein